jgi:hypothetical protein
VGAARGLPVRVEAALHDTSIEMIEKHYAAADNTDMSEELARRTLLFLEADMPAVKVAARHRELRASEWRGPSPMSGCPQGCSARCLLGGSPSSSASGLQVVVGVRFRPASTTSQGKSVE